MYYIYIYNIFFWTSQTFRNLLRGKNKRVALWGESTIQGIQQCLPRDVLQGHFRCQRSLLRALLPASLHRRIEGHLPGPSQRTTSWFLDVLSCLAAWYLLNFGQRYEKNTIHHEKTRCTWWPSQTEIDKRRSFGFVGLHPLGIIARACVWCLNHNRAEVARGHLNGDLGAAGEVWQVKS